LIPADKPGGPEFKKMRFSRIGGLAHWTVENRDLSIERTGTVLVEREDWTAFRNLEGLCRKAGVPQDELAGVVIKELVDNALDEAGDCDLTLSNGVVTIKDGGKGISGTDEDIARLFSINRPGTSSKYSFLPTRGALGNGLRVVVGAVVATGGKLRVSTRGRTLLIRVDPLTGRSQAIRVGLFDGPGTLIEIVLGSPLEPTPDDLFMADIAIAAAKSQGKRYKGHSSPHWHDTDTFHELLRAAPPDQTVRQFIAQFDGCSARAGAIIDGFAGRLARGLDRKEARELLSRARGVDPFKPDRLGYIGKDAFSGAYCRKAYSRAFPRGSDVSSATVPIVVEAWAELYPGRSDAIFMVNGTPCVAGVGACYVPKEKKTIILGQRLRLELKTGKVGVLLHVNVISPRMPMTNDGKAPALGMLKPILGEVIEKAVNKAKRMRPAADLKPDQKSVVFAHMEEQIRIVSDNRRYRFHWRQVFYKIRPIVAKAIGEQLQWKNFEGIVNDYEGAYGEEPMGYRDPRGTFYVPHSGESIPLGTLQVEQFRRPDWHFNKVLFIEKEGFFEALKADGFPERHDCALMTSKGQPTRAARDLLDLLGESGEPVQVFCLHDCDAAGTKIRETLQEATRIRPRRSIEIEDLGLDPWEAVELAERGIVDIEDVTYEKRQDVAAYITKRDPNWGDWLQTHRVELNAFTTPQFFEWLERKMSKYTGKVVPPAAVMADQFNDRVRRHIRDSYVAEALAEARIDERVDQAMAARSERIAGIVAGLPDRVSEELRNHPRQRWVDVVEKRAATIAEETDRDLQPAEG
jgi:hypothetical protein